MLTRQRKTLQTWQDEHVGYRYRYLTLTLTLALALTLILTLTIDKICPNPDHAHFTRRLRMGSNVLATVARYAVGPSNCILLLSVIGLDNRCCGTPMSKNGFWCAPVSVVLLCSGCAASGGVSILSVHLLHPLRPLEVFPHPLPQETQVTYSRVVRLSQAAEREPSYARLLASQIPFVACIKCIISNENH